MKFFGWMQSKFNGGQGNKRPDSATAATNHTKKEPPKEEFIDWPNGLLTIGTFGHITDHTNKQQNRDDEKSTEIENISQELQCSSPDFSEFTAEEIGKLEKDLKSLLNKKQSSKSAEDQMIAHLPLDRFINCPSSLDNRTISNRFSTYSDGKDEEEIDRTIRIILGRCKDVCENKKKQKNKTIGKESLAFLVKKMLVCRSGFLPSHNLRDTFHESRMEKLMRTLLTKKIYSQNSYKTSSTTKHLESYQAASKPEEKDESSHDKNRAGSKWDKTDSEYIVLEI